MSRLASVLLEQQNLLFKKKSSKIQQQKRNVWSSKMKNTANKGTEAQLDSIRARFRSWELWVMGPPCFRCATLMLVSKYIRMYICNSCTDALFNTELRPFDGHSEASDTILLPTESAVAFGIMYNS